VGETGSYRVYETNWETPLQTWIWSSPSRPNNLCRETETGGIWGFLAREKNPWWCGTQNSWWRSEVLKKPFSKFPFMNDCRVHAWYLSDFTLALLNVSLRAQEYLMQEIEFLQVTCYYYEFLLKIPWHFIGWYVFQIWQHMLFVSYDSKLIQYDSCVQSSKCLLPFKTDLTSSYHQLRVLIHHRKVAYWPEFYN